MNAVRARCDVPQQDKPQQNAIQQENPVRADCCASVRARCDVPQQDKPQQDAIKQKDPQNHHRRSIRLKGYDYSQAGAYFVTICVQNRECLFCEIVDGQMQLNDAGKIVQEEWLRTGEIRPNVELDAFMVMPNHFHGIIVMHQDCRGTLQRAPTQNAPTVEQFGKPTSNTIPTFVRLFKSVIAKASTTIAAHRRAGLATQLLQHSSERAIPERFGKTRQQRSIGMDRKTEGRLQRIQQGRSPVRHVATCPNKTLPNKTNPNQRTNHGAFDRIGN